MISNPRLYLLLQHYGSYSAICTWTAVLPVVHLTTPTAMILFANVLERAIKGMSAANS